MRQITIIALLCAAVYLLWRILKQLEKQPQAPQDNPSNHRQDPLNVAGYKERENRFNREIQVEERLGKK